MDNLEAPVNLEGCIVSKKAKIGRYTYARPGTKIRYAAVIGRFCSIAEDVDINAFEHPTDWLSTHPFQFNNFHFGREKSHPNYIRRQYRKVEKIQHKQLPDVVVGSDVWIGAKAIVRRGVVVGDGAIIGAGSFVNKDVPPYAIVAGTPARVIKFRFPEEIILKLLEIRWWEFLVPFDMKAVRFDDINVALEQIEALVEGKKSL